tara:strand:- start:274 stop:462 length:189 start_codon:yes stop_codon:yes gene_type:complete
MEILDPILGGSLLLTKFHVSNLFVGTKGYVIALPQNKYGEKIQPTSLILKDLTSEVEFTIII